MKKKVARCTWGEGQKDSKPRPKRKRKSTGTHIGGACVVAPGRCRKQKKDPWRKEGQRHKKGRRGEIPYPQVHARGVLIKRQRFLSQGGGGGVRKRKTRVGGSISQRRSVCGGVGILFTRGQKVVREGRLLFRKKISVWGAR